MKKSNKWIAILLLVITALVPMTKASAEATNYTYTYDFWDVNLESPDSYTAESILIGSDLGVGDFKDPRGLFIQGEHIYIVDTGNSRIVEIDKDFQLIRVIDKVLLNGEESTLKNPNDIFVSEDGELYIFDTENFRVLHTDRDLNVIKVYTAPEEEAIFENQNFIPMKGVVDTAGRMYLLAKNVNKGLMEFDKNGEFTVYVGASPVKASFFQVIQKRLMTKEQRARMELFVPTEYSNISIDQDNFLYVTTTTFSEEDLSTVGDKVSPIRKLNSLGNDILIRNGYANPIGDLYWGNAGDAKGPSRFEDITALDNDTYYALDRIRGRIFAYDFQGNLLYAFGGRGNKKGYFLYPTAIDHMGNDLFVLDSRASSVTKFILTEYGKLINDGLATYKRGHYEESADYWKEVLRLNSNYDLAYIGIGRALLRQGDYKEAMDYFELKNDYKNYSKAFLEYRKDWVEANIGYLIGGFIALILLPKIARLIKKLVKGGAQK